MTQLASSTFTLLPLPYQPKTRFLPHTTARFFTSSRHSSGHIYHTVHCRITKAIDARPSVPDVVIREPHKYFDHVVITVRSGDGGHGAVLTMPNQKTSSKSEAKNGKENTWKKSSYKRDIDGSLILPMGGHGGDVVIYADENKDSLLEFHRKNRHNAKRGGNVDAMGVLTSLLHDGIAAPTLRIPVPIGTVVKRKQGGKFLADLVHPGDEVLVARGGQGGISLLEMPVQKRKRFPTMTTNIMRDESDKALVLGQPGEEVSLELILRVVADVGLVGLPNAGKSTLLSAITLAKPDIADYPFTTLMPNLGRLGGDPSLGSEEYTSQATLADLPGLIEGAHLGKGLGRNFLRHLRRTRLLVHVVDAAGEDPVRDYTTVREELRMYNPNYLERSHVVVLNKIDLPEAKNRLPSLVQEIESIGCPIASSNSSFEDKEAVGALPIKSEDAGLSSQIPLPAEQEKRNLQDYLRPLSVVGVSVLKGIAVDEMLREIRKALRRCQGMQETIRVLP